MSNQRSRVAAHVAEMPKSGIRRFFDVVSQMKDVISLGVGEPDFDTPWYISRSAITSLENGSTHYTSNLGIERLRKSICAYLERRFDAKYDFQNETIVTVGVSEALDLAVRALCSPGDEIIYHEPCFVSYAPVIKLAHAVAVPVATTAANGFKLDIASLENKVTSKTKALLVNFPCNPTGCVMSPEEMKDVLEFCRRHDIVLLADEVYSELRYDLTQAQDECKSQLVSFASFPEYHDIVVLLNGFSKSWAMTGFRLGYACGPEDIIDAMLKIHQYGIMSAPTTSQAAGITAMDLGDNDVARMRREYKKRRDHLVSSLNNAGLKTIPPNGAFYVFSDISSTGLTDEEFAVRLLKESQVAVVPGSAFGESGKGYVRMSYATAYDKIQLASKRITSFIERLRS